MTEAQLSEPTPVIGNKAPKIIGFVCEWSVGRTNLINPDGSVRGLEHIKTMRSPCSGFVKPEWVTVAFENGAQGVFVLGCPLGDCHFNEGNYIISTRLGQHVGRLKNRKVLDDVGRVAELYLGATEGGDFTQMLREFSDFISSLPELAPPQKKAPRRAASTPAAAPRGPDADASTPAAPSTPEAEEGGA